MENSLPSREVWGRSEVETYENKIRNRKDPKKKYDEPDIRKRRRML